MTKFGVELAKGFGTGFLTEALLNDTKLAWCEQNMSQHQANCLRAAQSKKDADGCGIGLNDDGNLYKK